MLDILEKAKRSAFFKDSFWAILGNVFGRGFSLIAGIIVARILGKNVFGEFNVIKSTLNSFAIISTMGLGYTATKYIAQFKVTDSEKLHSISKFITRVTIFLSVICAGFTLIYSSDLSNKLFGNNDFNLELIISASWIVFFALSISQSGILAGLAGFKQMAIVNILSGLATLILTVVFALLANLRGALIAMVLSQLLSVLGNAYVIRRYLERINIKENIEGNLRIEIVKYTIPIAIQELIYALSTWSLNLLLLRFSNVGEVGLFSAALQWINIILFIPSILRNVILSYLSSKTTYDEQIVIINRTIIINLFSTLLPSLLVLLFGGFLENIYGKSFLGLGHILTIACFSTIFTSLTNVYSQVYLALGKNWLIMILRLFRDIGLVLVSWYLLLKFRQFNGAYVAVCAMLSIHALYFFITYFFYCRIIKVKQG